jgi:hypothetical protein
MKIWEEMCGLCTHKYSTRKSKDAENCVKRGMMAFTSYKLKMFTTLATVLHTREGRTRSCYEVLDFSLSTVSKKKLP